MVARPPPDLSDEPFLLAGHDLSSQSILTPTIILYTTTITTPHAASTRDP